MTRTNVSPLGFRYQLVKVAAPIVLWKYSRVARAARPAPAQAVVRSCHAHSRAHGRTLVGIGMFNIGVGQNFLAFGSIRQADDPPGNGRLATAGGTGQYKYARIIRLHPGHDLLNGSCSAVKHEPSSPGATPRAASSRCSNDSFNRIRIETRIRKHHPGIAVSTTIRFLFRDIARPLLDQRVDEVSPRTPALCALQRKRNSGSFGPSRSNLSNCCPNTPSCAL